MQEIALYRKYRPRSLEGLMGQDSIKTIFTNMFKGGHITHAFIFSGSRGTGKTSLARIFASIINCPNRKDEKACLKCDICIEIKENKLIDIIEVDAASNRGIDEIRELKDKIKFAPTRADKKIYIIDEVHMLTKEAFNALLKTLEEPPSNVYFILCTTEIHKIPETIISRCQVYDFKRIKSEDITKQLTFIADKEKVETSEEVLNIIAKHSEGGMRDAIGLFEQLINNNKITLEDITYHLGLSKNQAFEAFKESLLTKSSNQALDILQEQISDGVDLQIFIKDFLLYIRSDLLENIKNSTNESTSNIILIIDALQKAYEQMKFAPIQSLPLEVAVIRICLGAELQEKNIQNHSSAQKKNPKPSQKIVKETKAEKKEAEVVIKAEEKTASITKDISKELGENQDSLSSSDKKSKEAQAKAEKTKNPQTKEAVENKDKIDYSKVKKASKEREKAGIDKIKEEGQTTEDKDHDLTVSDIKEDYALIVSKIAVPKVRLSFKTGIPVLFDKNDLIISFNSKFHLEILDTIENKNLFYKAFSEVYTVKCNLVLKYHQPKEKQISKEKEEFLEEAKNIFA